MQSLQESRITDKEVISYLSDQVEIDKTLSFAIGLNGDGRDVLCSKTALEVVKAAAIIVHNDIGSPAAELLGKAFNSQNISS